MKLILTILLSFLFVVDATSQTTRQNLLSRQQRSGEVVSSEFVVPSTARGLVKLLLDFTPSDLTNPQKGAELVFESFQNGQFFPEASIVYIGGVYTSPSGAAVGPPGFILDSSEYAGRRVRARIIAVMCDTRAVVVKPTVIGRSVGCEGAVAVGGVNVGINLDVVQR